MRPEDKLLALVRRHISTVVAPDQVEVVTVIVAQAITALMTDPTFLNELHVVHALRAENVQLRSQLTQLQRHVALTAQRRPVKRAAKRTGKHKRTVVAKRPKRPTATMADIPSPFVPPKAKRQPNPKVAGNANKAMKAAFVKGYRDLTT